MTAALDLRPLRESPAFRRLWIGGTASATSSQLAQVAVLFSVWELTGSSVQVGAVGLAAGLATAVFGLVGGTLADRLERRRLVLCSGVAAAAAAVALAAAAAFGVRSALLVIVLVGVQTGCTSLGQAARRTFVGRLLGRERLGAGLALQQTGFQVAMFGGPALGGIVLAAWGAQGAFAVDAVVTVAALHAVLRLPPMRPQGDGTPRSMLAGLRFLVGERALRAALVVDLAQTVLSMPIALFPAVNDARFGGDPRTLGLLLSAVAVGGIAAGLVSGPVGRTRRPGLVSLVAAGVWGLALAGFGLVGGLLPTLASLAVAGAADVFSVIARGTLIQLATPDAYLGRVTAVEYVVGAGAPGIGNARAGLVAGFAGPELAAVTGGLACALVVALCGIPRPLRSWTVPTGPDDHVTR
ncbi:MFS transporter [Pseudonocardia ailaonensis]|uniref:MFS transporter n=1 Tax=Pseudonocardia ailaonensis TaxID=367279 RepID=A0ABN2MSR0_9PSEU